MLLGQKKYVLMSIKKKKKNLMAYIPLMAPEFNSVIIKSHFSQHSCSVTGNGTDSCKQLSCYSFASAIQFTMYFQIMLKTLHHVSLT